MQVETKIRLNKFKPRDYQLPLLDAIENKGYKRVLAIMPRRAGKDITAFQLCIRQCLKKICVVYYIFPTYSQAKKVIWDSITNTGERILDFIPPELVTSKNSQEMKIRFTNGSLLQLVGSDNFDCFDDQTEILTKNGWKLFKDLDEHEAVATLSFGILSYEIPLRHMQYDYEGEVYGISNSSLDFRVTPNHRFYVRSTKGKYKFKYISDSTIRHDMIPSQCRRLEDDVLGYPGTYKDYETKWFIALLGIFLAEGSTFSNNKCYRVTISQTKVDNRKKITDLLNRLCLNFVETATGFNIENKKLYEYFSQFGLQHERYIPKEILMDFSKDHLETLFEWLVMGDGHKCKTYTAYYSTSKQLIDDVQQLIIHIGLSANVYIKSQKASLIKGRVITPKKTLYEIRVRKSKYKRLQGAQQKTYIKKFPYKGKVYCVSVPSGVIKVRRNGKECWSGNSLMGTNPYGVVFSEYALQDPRAYQYIRPILTANDGWALFISTPRGKNHLWELYQIAKESPDWFCYKLSVEDTGHISLAEIEKEREEGLMSDDLIMQEYYCSFEMGVEGAYYAKYLDRMRVEGRIGQVPWENGFKVHTAWDLGVRDSTTIIFFQVIGQTVRLVDCYSNTKEGLEHYVKILDSKPYSYGKHIAPHDIKVKEWGSGITRLEKARQLGVTFTTANDVSIVDGIEAVRTALSKVYIDDVKCKELLRSLENYRQEYDIKKKVYKNHPLHDFSSHFADAMRYLCVSLPKTRDGLTPQELDKRYKEALYGPNSHMPSVFRTDLPDY